MSKEIIYSKDNSWIMRTTKNIVLKLESENVIHVFTGHVSGGRLKYTDSELKEYILETEKTCRFCENETDHLVPITFTNHTGKEHTLLYFLCCDECKKRPYLSGGFIKNFKDISSLQENDENMSLKKSMMIHTITCKCCGKQKSVLSRKNGKASSFCKMCFMLRKYEGFVFVKDTFGNNVSIIGTEEAEKLVRNKKAVYNSRKEICVLDESELYVMKVQKEKHTNILYVYENGLKSKIITEEEAKHILESNIGDRFSKYVIREFR